MPLRAVPLILTDFSSEPCSAAMLASVAAALAPSCDAVLVGEHQDRPDFPPTLHASLLLAAGVRPWMTLTCRDRNRIVLEEELTGLRELGVDAVLCVTGDARAYDVRPDVTQVFDLDGPRLAALAASVGVSAAVPETPTAPPRPLRAFRLVQKQRAGAAVAVLNHASAASVAGFMARGAGRRDHPGHRLGRRLHRRALGGRAQRAARPGARSGRGARACWTTPTRSPPASRPRRGEARALLAIPGVAGVNISGLASARGYEFAAQVKAELAQRIREGGRS